MKSAYAHLASFFVLFTLCLPTPSAHGAKVLDALLAFCHRSPYQLAQRRAHGERLSTHEAYAIGKIPDGAGLKAFLREPTNWLPERLALHEALLKEKTAHVQALSRELRQSPIARANPDVPLLVLTRGNSGSGKSFAVKNGKYPFFDEVGLRSAMEKASEGVINPDTLKMKIQTEWEKGKVSVQQVHEEGSALADRLAEDALARHDCFVVDKRFPTEASVEAIAKKAKARGYRVVLIDLDAPLEDSSRRILARPVGGNDPNVPFAPVEGGFAEVREHRAKVASSEFVDDYFAFSSDSSRPPSATPIAWRIAGKSLVVENSPLWTAITQKPGPKEKEAAARLYGELLDAMSSTLPNEFLLPLREGAAFDSLPFPTWFIPEAELPPPEGQFYRYALRDTRYEVQKGGGDRDHQLLAHYIEKYLMAVWPDIRVKRHFTPGTPTRNPSERITISHDDPKVLRKLLSDRSWSVRVDPTDGRSVFIDTREVGQTDWHRLVEPTEEVGIGFNRNATETPGSVGHEYLKTAHQMDFLADLASRDGAKPSSRRVPKAPLLWEISVHGSHVTFGREAETARFRYGYSLDEPHAYSYGAKVNLLQAEKRLASQEPAEALRLVEAAEKDIRVSDEMIALALMGLETPATNLDRRADVRPRESWMVVPLNQSVATDTPLLRFHFHSEQARARLGEVTDGAVREELVKTKAWLQSIRADNDVALQKAKALRGSTK